MKLTATFINVHKNILWNDILQLTQSMKSRGCRPIPYNIITEMALPQHQFDLLTKSISNPNQIYIEYVSQSIPSKNGVWNCISIKQQLNTMEILLYTAGRTFPLYLAVNY